MDLESILDKCNTISTAKSGIKSALEDYGFTVTDAFNTYADLIRQISQTTYTTSSSDPSGGSNGTSS